MSSTLSDVIKSHPVHLHDTQVDLESSQDVLDSHVWPTPMHYAVDDPDYQSESVPIIDLMSVEAEKLIGNACENWGVFQVTNHGIPLRIMEEVESQGKRLFSLPYNQKLTAARKPEGITGYGRVHTYTSFENLMWSEGFTMAGSPIEHAQQLWPQDYEKFCDVMEEYQKEMKILATRILCVMLKALGISKEDLKWSGSKGEMEEATAVLQMNSYPPCPDPSKAVGMLEHTDSSLLTLIYQQNDVSGLEILRDGVGWIKVQPVNGAFVVNVADMLHILSNGRYHSVLHRAVIHPTCRRLFVAYFYIPTSEISPHSSLIDLNNPPLYRTVTWKQYVGEKAKHFNKTLSSVRIIAPRDVNGPDMA